MINFQLSDEAMDKIQSCETREARGRLLVAMIDEKIAELQSWSRRYLGEELAKFEVAAVKTFLYRELTGELSDDSHDIMNLPRVAMNEHPASTV